MFSISLSAIPNFFYNKTLLLFRLISLYFAWIFLHYIASHLYIKLCTPYTIFGFLTSPFIAPTPQCQALRWVIYHGGNNIVLMWCYVGTWTLKQITLIQKNSEENRLHIIESIQ